MSPTKEQWDAIENQLSRVMGRVELVCDGYKINANVEKDKMKLVITVYVDGYIKGEWMKGESEIARKFHQEKKRFLSSFKIRTLYIQNSKSRLFSKEERAEFVAKSKATYSLWYPYWTNAKAFCRQIRKTCTSIEIVKIGY